MWVLLGKELSLLLALQEPLEPHIVDIACLHVTWSVVARGRFGHSHGPLAFLRQVCLGALLEALPKVCELHLTRQRSTSPPPSPAPVAMPRSEGHANQHLQNPGLHAESPKVRILGLACRHAERVDGSRESPIISSKMSLRALCSSSGSLTCHRSRAGGCVCGVGGGRRKVRI
eukprot:s4722_g6.t1